MLIRNFVAHAEQRRPRLRSHLSDELVEALRVELLAHAGQMPVSRACRCCSWRSSFSWRWITSRRVAGVGEILHPQRVVVSGPPRGKMLLGCPPSAWLPGLPVREGAACPSAEEENGAGWGKGRGDSRSRVLRGRCARDGARGTARGRGRPRAGGRGERISSIKPWAPAGKPFRRSRRGSRSRERGRRRRVPWSLRGSAYPSWW